MRMFDALYGEEESVEDVDEVADTLFDSMTDRDVPLSDLLREQPDAAPTASTSAEDPAAKRAKMAAALPPIAPVVPKVSTAVPLDMAQPVIPDSKERVVEFGLAKDDQPKRLPNSEYQCQFCTKAKPNRESMMTHTRMLHTGVCLMCPYCEHRVWGSKGWLSHLQGTHPGKDLYPVNPPVLLPPVKSDDPTPAVE